MLQAFDEKLRLKINGVCQELAQLFHPDRLACLIEFDARIPRTTPFGNQDLGELGPAAGDEVDKSRKTFLERAAHALWIPDEVPDAEGREIFS